MQLNSQLLDDVLFGRRRGRRRVFFPLSAEKSLNPPQIEAKAWGAGATGTCAASSYRSSPSSLSACLWRRPWEVLPRGRGGSSWSLLRLDGDERGRGGGRRASVAVELVLQSLEEVVEGGLLLEDRRGSGRRRVMVSVEGVAELVEERFEFGENRSSGRRREWNRGRGHLVEKNHGDWR